MKRIYIFILGILFFNFYAMNIFGQSDQFNSIVEELIGNVKTVNTSKLAIEQEIKIVQPGVISLIVSEIDDKGSREEFIYEFNLADIDPIMVREITEKEKMFVQLITVNNQKLISITKNGELDSYDKIIKIHAENIDNARKIKELVKNLIPVAENIMKNKFSLETYEKKLNWLTENVKDVNINNESYQQILTTDELSVGKVNLEVIKTTEKSTKAEKFEFNIADINVNSIRFNISGAIFSIVFETKGKQKFIKCYEDNNLANYNYKIEIVAYNIENAHDLMYVLDKIVPQAEEKLKNSLPVISDLNKATELLSENIKTVVIDNSTYNQSLLNECITNLNVIEDDMKKRVDTKYIFNLSDINHNSLNYKIGGKKIEISFQTKGANKLIKVLENDEQQNYINKIELLCYDTENARLLMHIFKKTIPICESNIVRLVPEDNLSKKVDWLIENTIEVTLEGKVYNQLLERTSDNDNSLRLTLKEINDKKNIELIYEFNLSDINPNSVKYDISGKELSVNMVSNYNTKVIKTYKDGEIQSYSNQMNIYVTDIESARNIILALKECITENTD
ncbi:MAG: hypothetical protein KOO66_00060 [Bacteroidales bacterium]|nr:hypothetical protein [Bacteroidales bacterium]